MGKNIIVSGFMFLGVFLLSGSPLTSELMLLSFFCIGLALLLSWRWVEHIEK